MAMSKEDVRDALLAWVSRHWCYSSKAGKEMHIKMNISRAEYRMSLVHYGGGEWWWSMCKKPHFRIWNQKSDRSCLLIGASVLSSIVNNFTCCRLQFTFLGWGVGGGSQWAKWPSPSPPSVHDGGWWSMCKLKWDFAHWPLPPPHWYTMGGGWWWSMC